MDEQGESDWFFVKFSNRENEVVRPGQMHVLTSHLWKKAGSRALSQPDGNEL